VPRAVRKSENCLPMIRSGKPHNEMISAEDVAIGAVIDKAGRGPVERPY
jgi:acetolactate synthase-1/2/3 large subunit